MLHLIDEVAHSLVSHLEKLSTKTHSIEAKESLAKYGTEVISSCAFGIRANCFEHENAEFRVISRKMFQNDWKTGLRQTSHFFMPFLAKALRLPFFANDIQLFLREAFWAAIKDREESKVKRNDVVDMILQIKNEETDENDVKFGKMVCGEFLKR